MIFPWNQQDWGRLTQTRNKLHHGLLINGQPGIGKREFSLALCHYILCSEATEDVHSPCGHCQNCRLFEAGTHPDFHVLTSEFESFKSRLPLLTDYSNRYQDSEDREKKKKKSQVINVNQVRTLTDRFSTHAHISSTKVALILPADCMNINAANALLKLLEEPPENSIIVLVTANPGYLPATIRSRCMAHVLTAPDRHNALAWLAQFLNEQNSDDALSLAGGGPLEARRLAENGFLEHYQACLKGFARLAARQVNPIDLASQLNKFDFELQLLWFHRFVSELIKFCVANVKPSWMKYFGVDIRNVSVDGLYGLYDRICYYRRIARDPLNEQLAIEDLVLAFQRIVV